MLGIISDSSTCLNPSWIILFVLLTHPLFPLFSIGLILYRVMRAPSLTPLYTHTLSRLYRCAHTHTLPARINEHNT